MKNLISVLILTLSLASQAKVYAVSCSWDGDDLIYSAEVGPDQNSIKREIDLNPGTLYLNIEDLREKRFVTKLEFHEKGKVYYKLAHCFMVQE